jgi:hypothetical protein
MGHEPKVLLVWGQFPRWIPAPQFSNRQTTLVAKLKPGLSDQGPQNFRYFSSAEPDGWIEPGAFDLYEYCARAGLGTAYDLVIVFAEQDTGYLPCNTRSFGCPTVLLVGDTHHFPRPISTLLDYHDRERFDWSVFQFTGHHLHWFLDAGKSSSVFLPGLVTRVPPISFHHERRDVVTFIGHHWDYHHYRHWLLERLRSESVPLDIRVGTSEEAAEAFSSSVISFNCSLNSDLNIRNFEVLAAGGFLLTELLPDVTGFADLFSPGVACDTFASVEELLEKIQFYRANPSAALKIAGNGLAWFHHRLNPQLAHRRFWDLLEGRVDPATCRPPDWRCSSISPLGVDRRLRCYEDVQELHRKGLRVRVAYDPAQEGVRPADFEDLPRVELIEKKRNGAAFECEYELA